MRSVIYLICISLLFISCGNLPSHLLPSHLAIELQFIDVDDALLIKPDMSRKDVLDIIGKPTEVKAGFLNDDGDLYEIWLYTFKLAGSLVDPKLLPRKPPKNMGFDWWFDNKKSDFYIIFKNNQPVRWGDGSVDWTNDKSQDEEENKKDQ